MAHDIFGGHNKTDWSCGIADDLPRSARGYVPEQFWGPSQMESKLTEIMSKGGGPFGLGDKPDRKKAISMLADYMKAKKIGPKDMSSGIGAAVGSIIWPEKEQQKLFNKLDDVRFDLRSTRGVVGAGLFGIAGALAFVGIAGIYRTAMGK